MEAKQRLEEAGARVLIRGEPPHLFTPAYLEVIWPDGRAPMWMTYECGKGEIAGDTFTLSPTIQGGIVVVFDTGDHTLGRFYVDPMDVARAAYAALQAQRAQQLLENLHDS
jgi:hypothetical protein